MWKLKTAGSGGEEPPARVDNFQRQQKTCPSCVSLPLAQAVPEEHGGHVCSIVAPGAAPRGGGGVHGAGEYMGGEGLQSSWEPQACEGWVRKVMGSWGWTPTQGEMVVASQAGAVKSGNYQCTKGEEV